MTFWNGRNDVIDARFPFSSWFRNLSTQTETIQSVFVFVTPQTSIRCLRMFEHGFKLSSFAFDGLNVKVHYTVVVSVCVENVELILEVVLDRNHICVLRLR